MHGQGLRPVILVLLSVLIAPTCRKPPVNQPPLRPDTPSGPTRGDTVESYQFASSAADPEEDSVCIRFNWGDGDISGWSRRVASGETTAAWHAWYQEGCFRVSAQARDTRDSISEWSVPLAVAIATNLPPYAPREPNGPESVLLDSSATFTAAAADPEGERVAVRFSWGDGDTSDWSPWFESLDSTSMSHTWPDSGQYEVRAQARDVSGGLSPWSSYWSVVVMNAKWRYQTDRYVYSAPAIAEDGTVYIGSCDGCLYAVHPDGSLRWRYQTNGDVRSSPAIAEDGTVYFGSDDHYLYALNPDGTLGWRYQTGGRIRSSPAVGADGTVYFGSSDYYLYAVNPNGTQKWRYLTAYVIYSSPAIAPGGTIYCGSENGRLYAFRPDSVLEWFYQAGGDVSSSPAIGADGTVYVGSDDNYLYALNPDGSVRWQFETEVNIGSSPVVGSDGTVYAGSRDDCLYAINPDGSPKWQYEAGRDIRQSPAVAADGTVYVGSDDNCLHAIRPDGTLKWSVRTPGNVRSSPAIGNDGTVYVGCSDGCLYAIRADSPLANSAWPKFHHDNRNTGRVGP